MMGSSGGEVSFEFDPTELKVKIWEKKVLTKDPVMA